MKLTDWPMHTFHSKSNWAKLNNCNEDKFPDIFWRRWSCLVFRLTHNTLSEAQLPAIRVCGTPDALSYDMHSVILLLFLFHSKICCCSVFTVIFVTSIDPVTWHVQYSLKNYCKCIQATLHMPLFISILVKFAWTTKCIKYSDRWFFWHIHIYLVDFYYLLTVKCYVLIVADHHNRY